MFDMTLRKVVLSLLPSFFETLAEVNVWGGFVRGVEVEGRCRIGIQQSEIVNICQEWEMF